MSNGHQYNFVEGVEFSRIGAVWFVSYIYNKYIDKAHENFKLVTTWGSRKKKVQKFEETPKILVVWLEEVLKMDDNNLNKNKINLTSSAVKEMTNELLKTLKLLDN